VRLRAVGVSVCLMTRGPGGRVAAMLELLRPAADEIFVAVDERAEPVVAATLAAVADRLVFYPYAEPVDRPLPWLHEQCSQEWVLTVDDDEIPSAALVAALPTLVRATDVTHYWLPRRWLYPDFSRYLDEPPWRPDYLMRLVLNDRRLLRFPDETHRPIDSLGPGRFLEAPLYHADCLVNPVERRREKARRYEHLLAGKRVAGRPLNQAYYLPEERPGARTAAVPDEDEALVAAVLEAPVGTGGAPVSAPAGSRDEIDALWEGRPFAETAYDARLELAEPVDPFTVGEARTVDVRVENRGDQLWPWGLESRPEIRVVSRWPEAGGAERRTPLPHDVRPGDAALVPAEVEAPLVPGRHRLELDLVHEHVRWFGAEVGVDVEVRPRRRVALAGDERLVLDEIARLAEEEPELEPVVIGSGSAAVGALDAHAYLLGGAPAGRVGGSTVLAARAARLVAGARSARRGRMPDLPRGATELLTALAGCERLVVLGADTLDGELPLRALGPQLATIRAARALGVPVDVRAPGVAKVRGPLRRAVVRAALGQ
jgi:hypothetical protein